MAGTAKQQRKVFYTVGGNGTNLDPGVKVSPKKVTKASMNRKIKPAH